VRLRRQILGLEEAEILPADKPKKDKSGNEVAGSGKAASMAEPSFADGGMGKLDIGWLNSRSGRVGRDMEAELWEKARTFLEGLEKGESNGDGNGQKADDDGDEEMGI
jgi:Mediator complex protein